MHWRLFNEIARGVGCDELSRNQTVEYIPCSHFRNFQRKILEHTKNSIKFGKLEQYDGSAAQTRYRIRNGNTFRRSQLIHILKLTNTPGTKEEIFRCAIWKSL